MKVTKWAGRYVLSALAVSLAAVGWGGAASAASSSLVYLSSGQLVYNTYANQGQTNSVNTIPDFSNAGYMGGGVALPNVPVKQTVSPVAGDDRLTIQNAIDYVSGLTPDANGVRGAVYLNAGTYEVNGELHIPVGGVVLRGAGQGTDGTIIKDMATYQNDFIQVGPDPAGKPNWVETAGTRQSISTAYVPTGAKSFNVASASGFNVGDRIMVERTPNDTWITDLNMAQYGWTADDYAVDYERTITAKSGNTITIDAPIVQAMETKYGGGAIFKYTVPDRIQKVGVENLRIESAYASNTDENHGWNAIKFVLVENGWVSGVTARYFGYSAVNLSKMSRNITVQDSAYLDGKSQVTGGRRYSFNIENGATFNLFQRLYTSEGRHDFVTGSRVPGPNVFVDSLSVNSHDDAGPHHRYATGLLFDNIKTLELNVRNRGASGTGHGWAGAQTIFWNSEGANQMIVDSPIGAKNWSIGSASGGKSGAGGYDSFGVRVEPRSLYYQQLQDRLGAAAVGNVTLPEQLTGSIWPKLAAWAGNGKLEDATPTPNPGTNLALNKTYAASTTWSTSYTAAKAFDASTSTRWSASSGSLTNQWISVDFGAATTYKQVVIKESSYQRVTSYKLQSSNDGTTYTDIAGTSGTTIGASKTISFSSVNSRYLRLYISSASDEPTINEIEVYN
ncbi:discoidin domain-containing protein [Paenibacillus sp. NPDC056579]|uniref:discoidin domain-containing protein n=1 Tax=Paenibacillus sp. NPDC056579 TaxID=3345871 RepID=UPI00368B3EA6